MALLKLNGKTYFLECDSLEVEEVSSGRWSITMDGYHKFTVIGGRKSGGASNEWFCHEPRLYGEAYLPTKSMIAAIKLGAQY